MLEIQDTPVSPWPAALEPAGEGTFQKEPFDAWWARNAHALPNLHPMIAEQWIHRHWLHSPYNFLPLNALGWRLEVWEPRRILADVFVDADREFHPDHDYKAFNRADGFGPLPTAVALNAGAWDYPIIVLETPDGVCSYDGPHLAVRYLLIEGHCRMRYLNALMHRGHDLKAQELFILKLGKESDSLCSQAAT